MTSGEGKNGSCLRVLSYVLLSPSTVVVLKAIIYKEKVDVDPLYQLFT